MTVRTEDFAPQTTINNQVTSGQPTFVDRRQNAGSPPGVERRQFSNTYGELSAESKELAVAIDQYKLMHRRRFITYDEMLAVIKTLGYHK
jgi:hypothetical protein